MNFQQKQNTFSFRFRSSTDYRSWIIHILVVVVSKNNFFKQRIWLYYISVSIILRSNNSFPSLCRLLCLKFSLSLSCCCKTGISHLGLIKWLDNLDQCINRKGSTIINRVLSKKKKKKVISQIELVLTLIRLKHSFSSSLPLLYYR